MEINKDSSTNADQANQRMPINKGQNTSDTAKKAKKSGVRDPERPKDSPGNSRTGGANTGDANTGG